MILVIPLELVLSDKSLEHRLDTLLILWHIKRQVQEVVESIRRFLAFRTNDTGSHLSSPCLVYPGSMLDLGWEVPILSVPPQVLRWVGTYFGNPKRASFCRASVTNRKNSWVSSWRFLENPFLIANESAHYQGEEWMTYILNDHEPPWAGKLS